MIKLKKLLAGVIGAAMVLSSTGLTSFAAEQTTPATIDTTKKGSLTIHKYEYNGEEVINGTGAANDEVPEGANPLAGAGFTIYKVADVSAFETYYGSQSTELPSIGTFVENGAIKSEYAATALPEQVTGGNGIVSFENLELGFYVVIETTKPAAVTSVMAPFLVSIPMTTVDGADWLYDVHTFPKNGTKYGEVKLEKTGVNNVKLAGVTFVLQKQNAEGRWENITKKGGAAGDNTGDALNLTTVANGLLSVDGLTQGTYRFIETSRGNNDGYIMDGATAYEFEITQDGQVSYLGTTAESITIPVKNEKPDLKKEVQDRTEGTWKQDSDYNVGDSIPYRVTVDVPANIAKLKEFTVTDTPTNLKDNTESIEIVSEGTAVSETVYTVSENGNGFVITFHPESMGAYAGKQLAITYHATLLDTAVTTTAGNPNEAKLEYSNEIFPDQDDEDNPNTPENPDEKPGKDKIEDHTVVYTFKLNINKTGENNVPLEGVVFDLYQEVEAGTADAATAEEVKNAGLDASKTWKKLDTLTTTEDGTISKTGLANGTYYIVETKTNEGYNLLNAPVQVELKVAYTTSMTETWEWTVKDGVKTLVKHEIHAEQTTFTETDDTTGKDGYETQTVVNRKGFMLPTTGGMGTVIFMVGGIALALAGLLLILAAKKKTSK